MVNFFCMAPQYVYYTTVDVDWLAEYLTLAASLQVIDGGLAGEKGKPRASSDARHGCPV
jgi:hypothetical protein